MRYGKPLLYWEMKMMMVLKLRVKIKIWWQWCWIYIWVGPPVDARADEGDELVASLVDDKTADWQEKRFILKNIIYDKFSFTQDQRIKDCQLSDSLPRKAKNFTPITHINAANISIIINHRSSMKIYKMNLFYVEKRKMPKIEPSCLKLWLYSCFFGEMSIFLKTVLCLKKWSNICVHSAHTAQRSAWSVSTFINKGLPWHW